MKRASKKEEAGLPGNLAAHPDWSADRSSLPIAPPPSLNTSLAPWFGKARYPLIAFDEAQSRLLYANPMAEETLSLPMARLTGISLCDLAGKTPSAWLSEWKAHNLAGKALRLHLREGQDDECMIDLVDGGQAPGHFGVRLAVLFDATLAVRTEKALDYRKRLESLILSLSTHFLNLHGERIDNGIRYALRSLGDFAKADRSYIFQFSPDGETMANTHEWCAEGIASTIDSLQSLPTSDFPWLLDQIKAMKTVHVASLHSLPASAAAEKREWRRQDIRSLILVPMEHRGNLRGFLGFDAVRVERSWPDDVIALLRIAGELFINALERKSTDQALQAVSARYRSLFENAMEGIFQTSLCGRFLDVNPAMASILGFSSAQELLANNEQGVKEFYQDIELRSEFLRLLERDGEVRDFEGLVKKRDGTLIWLSVNARGVLDDDGKIQRIEGSAMDITQRKSMAAQMVHDALHDALTGLPNRPLLVERLGRAMDRLRRRTSPGSCLLLLDLDRFKTLNDGMGHTQGDRLLLAVTQRIETVLPPGATLARLGGDEFGILLEDENGLAPAIDLADTIQRQFEAPFSIESHEVFASVSIGIALAMLQGGGPEELIRDADTAMHQAKNEGRARYAIFDPSMRARAVTRLHLENDLRRAMERQEFFLVYQPIVELKNGRLMGFEALIRWRHPLRGVVPPIEFIPIAEETGFIVPLGRWVLEESCRQLRLWQDMLSPDQLIDMSVNISGKQFEGLVLAAQIEQICLAAGVHPQNLKLEITESAIIRNPEMATAVLKELQSKGFKLSLDDFGTGYSSLSYLHRFPFHNLKIDRSFVMKLEQDAKNDEIVKAINSMAKNLGMDVTAEGVETQGQWDRLKLLETPFGQGYLFSKPLSVEDATAWIEKMRLV